MPFPFSTFCNLLSDLERLKTRDPPYLPVDLRTKTKITVEKWFRAHRRLIDAPDVDSVALLSSLFPEKRTDRVYSLQEARLIRILGRCLGLNSASCQALQEWKTPGHGDLGACVESVLRDFDCEPKPGSLVTVEEVDRVLHQIASRVKFSSPLVRASVSKGDPVAALGTILTRLKSQEAKWLTRLILKNFSPVVLDETLILSTYHFFLPGLLRFQADFATAVRLLRGPLKRYHANPDDASRRIFGQEAVKLLKPCIGIKVGRPPFFKARSLDHCVKMAKTKGSHWVIERKYDGEYCEIHIDLSKGQKCIQILSKSGKDSTADRKGVHITLRKALRIGSDRCLFKRQCIVLAELVVFSDEEQRILEFHKIRKHVSRSGVMLGTDKDSQAHPYEHLMLVFFDVLLMDDEVVLAKSYNDRRNILRQLVEKQHGRAITSQRMDINLAEDGAMEILRYQFAAAIAYRTEGLVLKPAQLPFLSLDDSEDHDCTPVFIKLKKDYVQELGEERDVVDFAVIGASYDPKIAQKIGLKYLQFTDFYLGCVTNPEATRFGDQPVYEVVGAITADQCIPKPELQALNNYGQYHGVPFRREVKHLKALKDSRIIMNASHSRMSTVFTEPCVVEVLGSGYTKNSNSDYYMLRHPRILKLHHDRSWDEAATFSDLQSLARAAISAPIEGESQEAIRLTERLISKTERVAEREREQLRSRTSPRTETTVSPTKTAHRRYESTVSPIIRRNAATVKRTNPVQELMSPGERNRAAPPKPAAETAVLQESRNGSNSLPTPPTSSALNNDMCNKQISPLDAGGSASRGTKRARAEIDENTPPLTLDHCNSRPKRAPAGRLMAERIVVQTDMGQSKGLGVALHTLRASFRLGRCSFGATAGRGNCVLSNSVVMVTPCVRGVPWLVQDLLPGHGSMIIDDFRYIARDTALPAFGAEFAVPESQAYLGKLKVVLAEKYRVNELQEAIFRVRDLGIREQLLWFDWRVCEQLCFQELGSRSAFNTDHGTSTASTTGETLKQDCCSVLSTHFLGSTRWDGMTDMVHYTPAHEKGLDVKWIDDLMSA